MAAFVKGPGSASTPFGRNEFLRSVKDVKRESFTLAKDSVPAQTVDGTTQKITQPGLILADITSGADIGKVGPFQAGVTDGRQTLANIVGILETFLPWQLLETDVDIAAVYQATVVQAWCFELDAAGLYITLTNTTAAAMVAQKRLNLNFV